jgi:hypothetical protein
VKFANEVRSALRFCVATAVLAGCAGPQQATQAWPMVPHVLPDRTIPRSAVVPTGVDYGLHRECIRTPYPNDANFYYDSKNCSSRNGFPTSQYWTTAAVTCYGDQSWPINGRNSPVSETWTGNRQSGYTVELRTDYATIGNQCTAPTWTWVPLMDNWVGGGPLPRTDRLLLQFTSTFSRRALNSNGATRAFAGLQAEWTIATNHGPRLESFQVELNYYIDEPAWGKEPHTAPDVIVYRTPKSRFHEYWCALWGARMKPPITVGLSTPTQLNIKWRTILERLIDAGLFPRPIHGWTNSNVKTIADYVGTETFNTMPSGAKGGPEADISIRDYRESALLDQ